MTTQVASERLSGASLFHLFGRTVIGAYFLAQSAGLIVSDRTIDDAAIAGDLPLMLYWANFGFQALAAAAIIVGFQTMLAASVLVVHVVWTSWLFNFDPSSASSMSLFWKDIAMVGGLLVVIAGCRDTFSVDAMRTAAKAKAEFTPARQDDRPADPLASIFRTARG